MAEQHIEERPSWDCRACGKPWPCPDSISELALDLGPTSLRIHMWLRLEVYAADHPDAKASDMFARFLHWTSI